MRQGRVKESRTLNASWYAMMLGWVTAFRIFTWQAPRGENRGSVVLFEPLRGPPPSPWAPSATYPPVLGLTTRTRTAYSAV